MDTPSKGLYHPDIMAHNKAPYHYEKHPEAPHIIEAYNQLCGDQFSLYLDVRENTIVKAHFHGYGCAVSKAATSVLIQEIEGKRIEEVRKLLASYLDMLAVSLEAFELQGQASAPVPAFDAFAAANDFPARKKCATLSWEELAKFLKGL